MLQTVIFLYRFEQSRVAQTLEIDVSVSLIISGAFRNSLQRSDLFQNNYLDFTTACVNTWNSFLFERVIHLGRPFHSDWLRNLLPSDWLQDNLPFGMASE